MLNALLTPVFHCVGVALFILIQYSLSLILSSTRDVPGPALARFTKLWYLWGIYNGKFQKTNIKLHQKYGNIVRIAPNQFSIDDPSAVKIIYGLGTKYRKADSYYGFGHPDPDRFTLFVERDEKRHSVQRKSYSPAYTMSSLVTYEQFVDNCVSVLEQRLKEFSNSNENINLRHWLQCFAFDVIGEMTFSKRFGFLDSGEDVGGVIGSIDNKLLYGCLIGVYPSLHPLMFRLLGLLRGIKATGEKYILNFVLTHISERKARFKSEGNNGPKDFLTKFLESHAEKPDKFTDYNVVLGCFSNIAAGSDTTSVTLTSIMYNLCMNPVNFERLREEVDTMVEDGRISNPVTFKEAQNMPYLQAVIKEGLRMHPVAGLPLERIVPEGGATISKQFFPKGSVVGVNPWVAHHNTTVFGQDAHLFRPERWIGTDPAELRKMDQYSLAFGLGSRTCLGKNISLLEISKLIPQLVRKFDFELQNPHDELDSNNRWLVKQSNFFCKITTRPGY